jgi:hypothetical protein
MEPAFMPVRVMADRIDGVIKMPKVIGIAQWDKPHNPFLNPLYLKTRKRLNRFLENPLRRELSNV